MKQTGLPPRRPQIFVRRRSSPGTSPGTIVADARAPKPVLRVIHYDKTGCREAEDVKLADIPGWIERQGVTWIDVAGLGDAEVLTQLGEIVKLHRLAIEDVINVHQRPKVEEYEDTLFVVARMLVGADRAGEAHAASEQVSLFLAEGLVVSFQERAGDCFDPVRSRIRHGRDRIRHKGADYLGYALLDSIVDAYFPMLEAYGDRLEHLELSIHEARSELAIQHIHDLKRELLLVRRLVWPTREMLSALQRDAVPIVTPETRLFLRDCYDHAVHLIDIVENYREVASSLQDVHLSLISNRMNEVMKVLTVIATIFMPLTFIAGVYGMNFDHRSSPWNMPELTWRFGYPASLLLMAVIGIGMLVYFHRLGWIGRRQFRRRRQVADGAPHG